MVTDSFTVHIITNDIYVAIAKEVKASFDTSNYELRRLGRRRKNKKLIGLMKDELERK